jgi:hypothetical protein
MEGLRQSGSVPQLGFSPDSRTLVLPGRAGRSDVELLDVPAPMPGDPARIVFWSQVVTGQELDLERGPRRLSPAEWAERRQRLEALGGPPLPFQGISVGPHPKHGGDVEGRAPQPATAPIAR